MKVLNLLLTFAHNKIINLHIAYDTKSSPYYVDNSFMIRNSLFGTVTLTKDANRDKYFYSGFGVPSDVRETFSLENSRFGKNVIIFGVYMSLSVHVDNKRKIS